MDNFNIYSIDTATNEDVVVTFTAPSNLVEYVCRIYKDGEKYQVIKGNGGQTEITLDTTGKYKIEVDGKDKFTTTYHYESGYYLIDKDAPMLSVGESSLTMRIGDTLNVNGRVKASDNLDGDITGKVVSNIAELDLDVPGKKTLTYMVSDATGNISSKNVNINVVKNNNLTLMLAQIIIIVALLYVISKLSKYFKSLKVERRFAKYAVELKDDDSPSMFDVIYYFYYNVVSSLSEVLKKSVFITSYAKKYRKYLIFTDKYRDEVDIVASKMMLSLVSLFVAVISKALHYKTLGFYEISIPIVLGFYILDVLYLFRYRIYRNRIENDLLQAVIIMNNAFKSGRSIVQAIDLVGNELPGIVGNQFIIMNKEMSKGLSVDVVFKRFAERINQEEVNYLTASLTILNKTGGNIIKVFTSIEKSLFMKKKLRLELKSLTGSSKIIMWVLFLIPILYITIITFLNPAYFDAFFTTSLGIILSSIVVVFYVIYVIVVSKILKVRM